MGIRLELDFHSFDHAPSTAQISVVTLMEERYIAPQCCSMSELDHEINIILEDLQKIKQQAKRNYEKARIGK